MKARSIVISLFFVTALIGIAIWLAVEHQARLRLGDENQALRQQLEPMAGVVAENERLSNLVAQANTSQTLQGDQLKELLRLRGEVGILRQQGKDIETLHEEDRQPRAALEGGLKSQTGDATGAAATADYWPRASWDFAGYASPEAALQTALWAASKRNFKGVLSPVALAYQKVVEKNLEGKSESEASANAKVEFASLKSVVVLNREEQADDTAVLTVALTDETGAHTTKVLMKKFGKAWKFSSDP